MSEESYEAWLRDRGLNQFIADTLKPIYGRFSETRIKFPQSPLSEDDKKMMEEYVELIRAREWYKDAQN